MWCDEEQKRGEVVAHEQKEKALVHKPDTNQRPQTIVGI